MTSIINEQALTDYVLESRGSDQSYPFGPEASVFKVRDKMFALIAFHKEKLCITLKATPADVEVLTEQFDAIIPGYHMNKKHWITVTMEGDVSEGMIKDLVDGSYKLVVSKLPKVQREALLAK
ncbi:MmcQ/YjbR family DNA-binding protein [Vibrio tapetis subsp. quintayensis]|uniref:MmcQ/YjbR family DNA-binding protein n=1 Tax=Vibrio tapetis TaxID=52443 RepID=UPI0025B47FBD|nr:MmcQ/YjbR family DNA-binding protein [Vibrio tapetis]MDN3679260.1 MmcQ/YjbR family DNA-binding protein [Vibrio tapetis subsp. quintayensis]